MPYLKIDNTEENSGISYIEIRKGVVIIEGYGNYDVEIEVGQGKKTYLRAKTRKERDKWLQAMLEALAKA